MKPLVTLIVAIYNTEPYLKRCIESIIQQSYRQMQVLLINDGSPDHTPQMCQHYADKYEYIEYVQKENGGVSSVRNLGLSMAKGDYICFIDSDDYLDKDYLKELVAVMVTKNPDLVVCGHYRELASGKKKRMCCKTNGRMPYEQAMCSMYYDNAFAAYPWNKLYKREVIEEYQLSYDLELRMTQDLVFVTEYMLHCKNVEYVAKPLYCYCYNENSVCRDTKNTGVFDRKKLITLKAHERTEELIRNCTKKVKQAFYGRLVCTYMRLMVNLCYSNTYDKELVNKSKKLIRKHLWTFLTRPAYRIFDRACGILIAISPRLFWIVFRFLYKVCGISV